MTSQQSRELMFFSAISLVVSILLFFVFKPFLIVLFLAITATVLLHPLYMRITHLVMGHKSIASVITVCIGIIFIFLPLLFLGQQAVGEGHSLYVKLTTNDVREIDYVTLRINTFIEPIIPGFDIAQYAEYFLNIFTTNIKNVVFGTITFFIDLFLIAVSLFFLLRDGEKFLSLLVSISPLREEYNKELLDRLKNVMTGIVKGTVLIALIQGLLAGVGFTMFGVPNAVLWAALAGVCSFIPGLGTALVTLPAVLYLFLKGSTIHAIGLLSWGLLLVGTIDNILGPYLYKRETQIHSLVMLFSILGGISLFGPAGLIIGPVIVGLWISLAFMYDRIMDTK